MPSTTLRAVVAASCCALALAGCGVSRDDEPTGSGRATSSPSESATPSPTATVTVTETPSPTPSSSAPPSAAVPAGAGGSLLATNELPRLNDTLRWRETGTGPATQEPFGLCQEVDLASIGATDVLERTWKARGGSLAAQEVVDFADPQTAARARKVLESWHAGCLSTIDAKRAFVGPLRPVTVASGSGWHYLVTIPRGDSGSFHAFGMALVGNRMTVLQMVHPGQDHNYEPGQDPMERAVSLAGTKLGSP